MVAVDDPLGIEAEVSARPSPLLIDTYVRVEIEGRPLRRVVPLPRVALQGDHRVWTVDDDGRLRARQVEIAWREPGRVYVASGLEAGDRVVTTPLAIATDGMKISESEPAAAMEAPEIVAADAPAPSSSLEQDG